MQDNDFLTADFLVAELLGDTYDDGGVLADKYYRWLFRIWNDLTLDFIKPIRKVILPVSSHLQIVVLPPDLDDWAFVGYIDDCYNRLPLAFNQNLAPRQGVEDKRVQTCATCGNVDLCKTLSFEEIYEPVMIGTTRTAKYITRVLHRDGSYIEEVSEPTAIIVNNQVDRIEMVKHARTVCKLAVSACGCVAASPENVSMLKDCGCSFALCCCSNDLLPYPVGSGPGSFNVYKDEGFIQLSPDSCLKSIYLEYISTGICKDNIMYFPRFAMTTLIDGAYSLSIQKKRGISNSDKMWAHRQHMSALKNMVRRISRLDLNGLIEQFLSPPRIQSL